MRKIDQLGIELHQYLLSESESFAAFHPTSNLLMLMWHEIMVYFTNYVIIRESKDDLSEAEIIFPFLNKKYVDNPYPLHLPPKSVSKKTAQERFIETLSKWGYKKQEIGISIDAIAFTKANFIDLALKYRISFQRDSYAYIPNLSKQFTLFESLLCNLAQKVGVINAKVVVDNFLIYTRNFVTDKLPTNSSCQVLLTGTRSNLPNRINTLNFLFLEKLVVGFSHGEQSCSILDDPYTSYGELSLCDVLVSYGSNFCCQENIINLYNVSPRYIIEALNF